MLRDYEKDIKKKKHEKESFKSDMCWIKKEEALTNLWKDEQNSDIFERNYACVFPQAVSMSRQLQFSHSSSQKRLTFWGNSCLLKSVNEAFAPWYHIYSLVHVCCPVRDCDFCFEQEGNPGAAPFYSGISGFIPAQLSATTINVEWMPLAKVELPELWLWVY